MGNLFNFWNDMAGQSNLGKIGQQWNKSRPKDINFDDVLGNIDFSGYNNGLGLLNMSIGGLNTMAQQDTSGMYRQNLREDMGASIGANNAQMNQFLGAGISPGMIAAMQRANTASSTAGMGRNMREYMMADLSRRGGLLAQAGGLSAQYAGLGMDRAQLMGGISSNLAMSNASARNQWGMNRSAAMSDAYQTNVANKADRNAGLLSMVSNVVSSLFGGGR